MNAVAAGKKYNKTLKSERGRVREYCGGAAAAAKSDLRPR